MSTRELSARRVVFGEPHHDINETLVLPESVKMELWTRALKHESFAFIVDHACWWTSRHPQEIALQGEVDQNMESPEPRLVLADWLEERGRCDEAALQRLFAETGDFPTLQPAGMSYGPGETKGCNYEWCIGMNLWERFGSEYRHPGYWHPSRFEAENELLQWMTKEKP